MKNALVKIDERLRTRIRGDNPKTRGKDKNKV